jgi:Flp pilus assembly pilin Flp
MSELSKAYIKVREAAYSMRETARRRFRENQGQTMAEYGLIVALVAVVAVLAWRDLGTSISNTVGSISGDI